MTQSLNDWVIMATLWLVFWLILGALLLSQIVFWVFIFIYMKFYKSLKIKKIAFIFAWYDMWFGLFVDYKKDIIYVFPIPTIGYRVELEEKNKITSP
jgi:hypothetical protein